MKKFIISFLLGMSAMVIVAGLLLSSPYYFYNQIINKKYSSQWFNLTSFTDKVLTPGKKVELQEPNLGNDDLWRKFHIKDTYIPLPYRNPFFFVAPIFNFDKEKNTTNFGISVFGASKLEISKIFFVNNRFLPSVIRSQSLFKLPIAVEIIKSVPNEKIWRDIFTIDLSNWEVNYSQLIYNLYILQLRSVILPKEFKSFSLLDDRTGLIELYSPDKDYKSELILTKQRGLIYSYLIVTDLQNNESQILRYKFLKEISFRPSTASLARILYKEFKALDYKDQVSQIGMMYLISAYSHANDKLYLQEMIRFLERGERNQTQLKRLYEYANIKYGETFTQKIIEGIELEDELRLKRNIELEKKRELERLAKEKDKPVEVIKTQEEKLQERIERAKKSKKIKSNRMIID